MLCHCKRCEAQGFAALSLPRRREGLGSRRLRDFLSCQVERPGELQEVVGHQRLQDNVSSILQRIERELDHVDSRIGESMHILDLDNDGLVRPRTLSHPQISASFEYTYISK